MLAAILVAFAVTGAMWKTLNWGQSYPEPVVGRCTWNDVDKARDFRAMYLLLGLILLTAAALWWVRRSLSRSDPSGQVARSVNVLLAFCLVPGLWWLGAQLSQDTSDPLPTEWGLLLVAAVVLLLALLRHRRELTGADLLAIGGAGMLVMGLSVMAGFGVALVINRFVGSKLAWSQSLSWLPILLGTAGAVYVLGSCLTCAGVASLRRKIFLGLLVVQAPLPLLYAVFVPPPLWDQTGLLPREFRPALPAALAMLGIVSLVLLARRFRAWWRSRHDQQASPQGVLSPLCLAAVAVFITYPFLPVPTYAPDHFHIGELLLPFQQWRDFGAVPFIDFIPIHGLIPLAQGALNWVFFDDTAASFLAARHMLYGLSVLALFLTLRPLVGSLIALLVCLAPPFLNRFYFLPAALLILVHPRLLAHPRAWIAVWVPLATVTAFLNAVIGAAAVAASVPMALWMTVRLLREDRAAAARFFAGLTIVILLVALFTPAVRIVRGLIVYLWENMWTTQIVHGVLFTDEPLKVPQNWTILASGVFWQLGRCAWLFVLIVAGVIAWRQGAARPGWHAGRFWLAVTVGVFLLLVCHWAFAQAAGWTRVGAITRLGVSCLLPAMLLIGRSGVRYPGLVCLLAVLLGFFSFSEYALSRGLVHAAVCWDGHVRRLRFVWPDSPLIDGASVGLPALGRIRIEPHNLGELTALRKVTDRLLRPGETYLDLTNRQARYYYLDMAAPGLYGAPLVACNRATQARVLQHLQDKPLPPVALIAPADRYERSSLSLGSYWLYRYFASRYVAGARERFRLLIDPDRAPRGWDYNNEYRLGLLDEVFRLSDYAHLPAAWGRSWHRMRDQFEFVAELGPAQIQISSLQAASQGGSGRTEEPVGVVWDVRPLGLRGADADFLLLDAACTPRPQGDGPRLEISWTAEGQIEPTPVSFVAPRSRLLVPMGAQPRWLLSNRLTSLKLALVAPAGCRQLAVKKIQLLRFRTPKGVAMPELPPTRREPPDAASRPAAQRYALDEYARHEQQVMLLARDLVDAGHQIRWTQYRPGYYAVFAHAPHSIVLPAKPGRRRVEVGFGIIPGAWQGQTKTDGVEFRVSCEHPTGGKTVLWSRTLDPVKRPRDRGPQTAEFEADLSDGDHLVLETRPGKTHICDWSFWNTIRVR